MSILIKGMEMPLEKSRIIQIHPDGTVRRLDGSIFNSHFEAVPVPPHGRLIDGDVAEVIEYDGDIKLDTQNEKDGAFLDGILYAADWIAAQPTIIPASEEGE